MSAETPEVGDLVERINSDLDPRPVARVGTVDGELHIALDIFGTETPPIPAHLYRIIQKAADR